VCNGQISSKDYKKTIRRIKLLFQGKKKELIRMMRRDMLQAAKGHHFEEASKIKRTIFGLEHIQDVALIKEENLKTVHDFRIESYDIAHISGTDVVGVMTVVENGEPNKAEYRKFKIKTFSGADDTRALKEVLSRRLEHAEWKMPRLIVIDGGKAQKNAAESVLAEAGVAIPVVSVVKDEYHKAREILGEKRIVSDHEQAIILANLEAHRFAVSYHRNLRNKRSFS
jgi:excinuclease ABC subunit C